jgi:polar amino acid transport system substrate-binding protein
MSFASVLRKSILCTLLLLSSAVSAGELPADIMRIKQNGFIRVSILNHSIFPFIYKNDAGLLDGIDIRLARKIAEELGVEVVFINTADSFNGVVQLVVDGEADIAISKISATLKRTENVAFSRPYLVLNQALLINRLALAKIVNNKSERTVIRRLQTDVGVIRGSSYEEYLAKVFPDATKVTFETWEDAVEGVFTGQVTALYRDDFEIKRVIHEKSNGSLLAKSVTLIDKKDEIAIAVNWQDSQLLQWVNKFLASNVPETLTADQVLKEHDKLLR